MSKFVMIALCVVFLAGQAVAAEDTKNAPKRSKVQESHATTFSDAMKEGAELQAAYDDASAEKSYRKALSFARTAEERGNASYAIAGSLVCQGKAYHKKAFDTLTEAINALLPDSQAPECARILKKSREEALRIALQFLKDIPAAKKICQQGVDQANLPALEKFPLYTQLAKLSYLDTSMKDADAFKEIDLSVAKALELSNIPEAQRFDLILSIARLYGQVDAGLASRTRREKNFVRARELLVQAGEYQKYMAAHVNAQAEYAVVSAQLYIVDKKYAQAREELTKVIELKNVAKFTQYSALRTMGRCFQNEGNAADALTYYNKALEVASAAHNEEWRALIDKDIKSLKK